MASSSKVYKTRIKLKARKRGRKRKNRIDRLGSTPSKEAVFAAPEKPAS